MGSTTGASTHGERRFAGVSGAAVALLDELDTTCKHRDLSQGKVGNLRGKVLAAQHELDGEIANLERLERKAARIRSSFETYMHGREPDREVDAMPEDVALALVRDEDRVLFEDARGHAEREAARSRPEGR